LYATETRSKLQLFGGATIHQGFARAGLATVHNDGHLCQLPDSLQCFFARQARGENPMPKEKDESDGGAGDVADEAIADDTSEPPAAAPEADADDERKRRALAERVRSKIKRNSGKTRYLN
jgi:hypothetical protein